MPAETERSPGDRNPLRGPLAGLRVIELGSVVAGPFAGKLLADYGADVIKIEAPDIPDPLRDWGQASHRGQRLWWTVHARNKRCITLDLRKARGRELLFELVRNSDAIIENFRPGTLERWGIGYARLKEVNNRLILVRISGFGQTGPYSSRPGYASVAEAMGGLRGINGHPGEASPRMAISLGDSLGGLFGVIGLLAAAHRREVSGEGQEVDVSLVESCLALTESMVPDYDRTGHVREPSGTRLDGIAPSNLYRTADELWVVVAANQDSVFQRLCGAMERPDLAADPRFSSHVARGEHQDELDEEVAAWVGKHSLQEVMDILVRRDVVVGPVYSAKEIVEDVHFRAREMLVRHFDERIDESVIGPGIVPKFGSTPGQVSWAGPPTPGTHNHEVLTGLLGLDAEVLAALRADAVI